MLDRYREHEADDMAEQFPEERRPSWFARRLPYIAVIAIIIVMFVTAGQSQELYGFSDTRLHAEHHHIYQTLHNQQGTHCCPVGDCRPTQAMHKDGNWYALVDGKWTIMNMSRFVKEYTYSWSETAHVCASPPTGKEPPYVFCFVRPGVQG